MKTFLGDIHGSYGSIKATDHPCIQVGDYGLFYENELQKHNRRMKMFPNFYWIRGNHDSPQLCQKADKYLGDFGYNEKLDIFFISGAFSIDKSSRIIGQNWWPDEELKWDQWNECIELFEKVKPQTVVSHDAPMSIVQLMKSHHAMDKSNTQMGLEALLMAHKPKYWIFGHHHMDKKISTSTTDFYCVGIGKYLTLEDI
jgi:predicted phosphohydrolase